VDIAITFVCLTPHNSVWVCVSAKLTKEQEASNAMSERQTDKHVGVVGCVKDHGAGRHLAIPPEIGKNISFS